MGNTQDRRPRRRGQAVHPHARGEHCMGSSDQHPMAGSSPRPWGTLCVGRIVRCHGRFIPTPVGNTRSVSVMLRFVAVHPHARGEHAGVRSSGWMHSRFIPTPVGNTCCFQLSAVIVPVHPHARGEHSAWQSGVVAKSGSSPRPWGTRTFNGSAYTSRRFIPTPVGNTATRAGCWSLLPVHPHARGEH